MLMCVVDALVVVLDREPAGMVQGDLEADRVSELRGLHRGRQEDRSADTGPRRGEAGKCTANNND